MSQDILLKNMNWKNKITRYLGAQILSQWGSALVQYALIWKITLETSSGGALALSTLCGFLPQFLVSPLAGVWADRYQRKLLIVFSDGLIALATFVLFIVTDAPLSLIYLVLAIRSLATGIQGPASQSALVDLVPHEFLQKVHGINASFSSLSSLLAPALSALVLDFCSFRAVLSIDLITAMVGIALMIGIEIPQNYSGKHHFSYFQDLKDGISYLINLDWLKRLLLYQTILMFMISPTAFMTPLYVSRIFDGQLWHLSLAEMTYSLGMVSGGILIAHFSGFQQKLKTTFMAGTFYGLMMIAMGSAHVAWLFYLANMLIGISSPCYNAPLYAHLQEKVEGQMMGRVFSVLGMVNSMAMPLGMLLFGPLADRVPIGWIFISCGFVVMLMSLRMFRRESHA